MLYLKGIGWKRRPWVVRSSRMLHSAVRADAAPLTDGAATSAQVTYSHEAGAAFRRFRALPLIGASRPAHPFFSALARYS